jgi:hypothetical protein
MNQIQQSVPEFPVASLTRLSRRALGEIPKLFSRGGQLHFAGEYTTRRDGGIRYAYGGSWWVDGVEVVWKARVWQDGVLKGEPDGRLPGPSDGSTKEIVKLLAEKAIERGSGLES